MNHKIIDLGEREEYGYNFCEMRYTYLFSCTKEPKFSYFDIKTYNSYAILQIAIDKDHGNRFYMLRNKLQEHSPKRKYREIIRKLRHKDVAKSLLSNYCPRCGGLALIPDMRLIETTFRMGGTEAVSHLLSISNE